MMLIQPKETNMPMSLSESTQVGEAVPETVDRDKEIEVTNEGEIISDSEKPSNNLNDQTKIENCTTKTKVENLDEQMLRLLEAASFTIYYEPDAYYVPEGDLTLLAEFAAVANKYPEEQIVIEGNVNISIGPEEEWDTETVEELGYTRGLVIKNDLIKRGIDKERILIYNNKDEKPLNVDLSEKSIALNRRTDVFFSQFIYKEIDTK